MKNIFFALCILFCLPDYAQNKSDLGLSLGAAYYMGDINPSTIFYSPKIHAGIVYRYNFNPRYVLKGELNYVALSGNDADFSDWFSHYILRPLFLLNALSNLVGDLIHHGPSLIAQ